MYKKVQIRKPKRQVATGDSLTSDTANREALKIVKSVKGPNFKYINSVFNSIYDVTTIKNTVPMKYLLNGVAQGTNENHRIGAMIKNKWLNIDLNLSAGNTNTYAFAFRVYLVVDTMTNGATFLMSQFLSDASTYTPTSQRNYTNINPNQFLILWDSKAKSVGPGPNAGTGTNTSIGVEKMEWNFNKRIALNFETSYFRSNNGDVTDIDKNSLYLVIVTDNPTAGDFYITGGYTLCFQDDN